MELLAFFLLLAATILGFAVGRWSIASKLFRRVPPTRAVPQRYFESLNQLLHEQHDVALETFVTSLEVNSDTMETHLALGSLLRKRGEVDRAIRIHQNLLARPNLGEKEMEQAQLELALDYKSSGLLDRAESLFRELQNSANIELRASALANLVDVYQEEQEWQSAIECAEQLCARKLTSDARHWRHLQANYSCELADMARQAGALQDFYSWTRQALQYEKGNPRAAINMSRWSLQQDGAQEALKWLQPLIKRPELLDEVLPVTALIYRKYPGRGSYYEFLYNVFQKSHSPSLYLPIADELRDTLSEQAALEFLREALATDNTLAVVSRCLTFLDDTPVPYAEIRSLIAEYLPPVFTCRQCGFEGARVYWCCPTCRAWL